MRQRREHKFILEHKNFMFAIELKYKNQMAHKMLEDLFRICSGSVWHLIVCTRQSCIIRIAWHICQRLLRNIWSQWRGAPAAMQYAHTHNRRHRHHIIYTPYFLAAFQPSHAGQVDKWSKFKAVEFCPFRNIYINTLCAKCAFHNCTNSRIVTIVLEASDRECISGKKIKVAQSALPNVSPLLLIGDRIAA